MQKKKNFFSFIAAKKKKNRRKKKKKIVSGVRNHDYILWSIERVLDFTCLPNLERKLKLACIVCVGVMNWIYGLVLTFSCGFCIVLLCIV